MAARWAELVGVAAHRRPRLPSARSSPSPIRIASPRTAAAANGAFLLANGRGAQVDPASALAREPYLAVAEIVGSAAQGRIVLAAAITLADIETRFADRIEAKEEITFDPPSASLRGRRLRRLGAIALAEQPVAVTADEEAARVLAAGIAKAGLDRLPWTKALTQWRDRVLFLRRAEGDEWPDLSDSGLAAAIDDWLTPMLAGKTSLAQLTADELGTALAVLLPYRSAPPARRRGADPFRGAVRLPDSDRLRGRGRSQAGHTGAGAFRPRAASNHCRRARSPGGRAPVARPPAGAGHARSAGVLARQLRRGAGRDARPLPAPSVARRPAVGTCDAARQASRNVTRPLAIRRVLAIAVTRRSGSGRKGARAGLAVRAPSQLA